jgi:Tfp pilus assembly ATPase PilU
MQTSRKIGMIMLNDSLVDLIRRDVVSPDEAYVKAVDKQGLLTQLKNAGLAMPAAAASTTS